MPPGRTADASLFIADADTLVDLINVLGLSITGSSTTSRQPFLRSAWEETSIHAISSEISFSTVFSTSDFDAAVATLIANSKSSTEGEYTFLVVDDGSAGSELWRAIPCNFGRPSFEAPETDAITRPWGLNQRARASWGVDVYPFTTTTASVRVATAAANRRVGVLLTENGTGVSGNRLEIGSATTQLGIAPGYREMDSGGASASVSVQSDTAGGSTGFVLVGQLQALPSG